MDKVAFILNVPHTLLGLVVSLFLLPSSIRLNEKPFAFIIKVRRDSFGFGYMKGWRGMTVGHVVILNPREEEKDLEHELIHVEQQMRTPLIQPILYTIELLRKGYRNNKYEEEAYSRAGNAYKTGKY